MEPSLNVNPTHESFSYRSFQVNHFCGHKPYQSKFTTVGHSKYIMWFRKFIAIWLKEISVFVKKRFQWVVWPHIPHNYPACACASKGVMWSVVIGHGVHILYICKKKSTFFLSFKILTFRHPFQHRKAFNRLQYTLAAPEVFVSSANPVSLPSGYRVSIVRNTNIDQIETTPQRYCMHAAC